MEKCKTNPGGQLRRKDEKKLSAHITAINHEQEPPVDPVEAEETNTELFHLNSPLQIPEIMNSIFKFLEFEDLKQCHLVCSKWNQFSISFLEKMSFVTLGYPSKNYDVIEHSPQTFRELFQNSDIQFRSFKLARFELNDRKWQTGSMIEFFQDQRETMQELIIENTEVAGHSNWTHDFAVDRCFDISPHIGNQLTHLSIISECDWYGSKFKVNTNMLTSLKSISLARCALEISNNCVLSPQKFELNCVALVKKDKVLLRFLINDLLDFKNLKELSLEAEGPGVLGMQIGILKSSPLALDLTGEVTLDNLSLKSVSLHDFENCQWKIREKLKLRCDSFHTRTRMNFSELDYGHKSINLDLLPRSLEKLTLSGIGNKRGVSLKVVCPPLFFLPNLKYFQLLTTYRDCECTTEYEENNEEDDSNDEANEEDHDNDSVESTDDDGVNETERNVGHNGQDSFNDKNITDEDSDDEEGPWDSCPTNSPLMCLNFFVDCPDLTTVKLMIEKGFEGGKLEYNILKTEWIPISTENLFLSGNIKVVGQEINFKKLVIEDNCLNFLTSTLKRLKSKHLVLDLHSKSQIGFRNRNQLQEIIWKLIKMPYESLAIGPLEITVDMAAFKSLFSNYVDERAGYYLFKDLEGRAIEKKEFKKMLKRYA